MENYWVSRPDAVVYWYISFPKQLVKSTPTILIRFTEQFSLMCAAYEIALLEKISNPIATWKLSEGKSYPEHVREVYERTGEILFFYDNPSRETPREDIFVLEKSRICFYTKDGLIEESVDDLGLLLNELCPHLGEQYRMRHPPVRIRGNLIIPDKLDLNKPLQVNPFLSIALYSDIWLPFVINYGDEYRLRSALKSNQELANCHSSRFNQWLKVVRQLGEDFGAKWAFDDSQAITKYKAMLSEDGINLNYRPT
jgi:hypothetical protein